MGVPAFYRWISQKYSKIISDMLEKRENVVNGQIIPLNLHEPNPNGMEYDNLYVDMNGLIHPCSHPEDREAPSTEEEMYVNVMKYIDRLVSAVRPRRLLYLAIDGVAPRAKMNQQRSRRFRAAQDVQEKKRLMEEVIAEMEELGYDSPEQTKESWDSNVITPGTEFMAKLSVFLKFYILEKMNTDNYWRSIKVIISDASVPGEGEHKIMEFIRKERSQVGYDPNQRHILHGLDADLIMLALATHEAYFSILREKVTFGRQEKEDSAQSNSKKLLEAQRFLEGGAIAALHPEDEWVYAKPLQVLHVFILREYLDNEFQCLRNGLRFGYDLERIIDDFVFFCFFVGNDFLPHLPSLDIRDGALDFLIECYKEVLPSLEDYITSPGGVLNLFQADIILAKIGEIEDQIFYQKKLREDNIEQRKNQQGGSDPSNRDSMRYPNDSHSHPIKSLTFEANRNLIKQESVAKDFNRLKPGTSAVLPTSSEMKVGNRVAKDADNLKMAAKLRETLLGKRLHSTVPAIPKGEDPNLQTINRLSGTQDVPVQTIGKVEKRVKLENSSFVSPLHPFEAPTHRMEDKSQSMDEDLSIATYADHTVTTIDNNDTMTLGSISNRSRSTGHVGYSDNAFSVSHEHIISPISNLSKLPSHGDPLVHRDGEAEMELSVASNQAVAPMFGSQSMVGDETLDDNSGSCPSIAQTVLDISPGSNMVKSHSFNDLDSINSSSASHVQAIYQPRAIFQAVSPVTTSGVAFLENNSLVGLENLTVNSHGSSKSTYSDDSLRLTAATPIQMAPSAMETLPVEKVVELKHENAADDVGMGDDDIMDKSGLDLVTTFEENEVIDDGDVDEDQSNSSALVDEVLISILNAAKEKIYHQTVGHEVSMDAKGSDGADAESKMIEIKEELKKRIKEKENAFIERNKETVTDNVRLHENGWKDRYYNEPFKSKNIAEGGGLRNMCYYYVQGLCWVLKYYYEGVPSWNWYYPFHYAPFASNLTNIDQYKISFELSKPFRPIEQLLAVLPSNSVHALPTACHWLMTDPESPIADLYNANVPIDPNGKHLPWLWILLLPFIDETRINAAFEACQSKLTLEEKRRNSFGQNIIIIHSRHELANFAMSQFKYGPGPEADQEVVNALADENKKMMIQFGDEDDNNAPDPVQETTETDNQLSYALQPPVSIFFNTEVGDGMCGYIAKPIPFWYSPIKQTIVAPELPVGCFRDIVENLALSYRFDFPLSSFHSSSMLEGVIPIPSILTVQDLLPRRPPRLNRAFNMLDLVQARQRSNQPFNRNTKTPTYPFNSNNNNNNNFNSFDRPVRIDETPPRLTIPSNGNNGQGFNSNYQSRTNPSFGSRNPHHVDQFANQPNRSRYSFGTNTNLPIGFSNDSAMNKVSTALSTQSRVRINDQVQNNYQSSMNTNTRGFSSFPSQTLHQNSNRFSELDAPRQGGYTSQQNSNLKQSGRTFSAQDNNVYRNSMPSNLSNSNQNYNTFTRNYTFLDQNSNNMGNSTYQATSLQSMREQLLRTHQQRDALRNNNNNRTKNG